MILQVPFKTAPRAACPPFRCAPLAGVLAMLCSGGASALPGEPVVDWTERDYVVGDAMMAVEVPISWQRPYGNPALTARYWIDDELAVTLAVEDGDPQSGRATLQIDRDGEHAVVVELCDGDGCTASGPVMVSLIDPGRAFRTADDAETDETMLGFDEARRVVYQVAERLGTETDGPLRVVAAVQSWGGWFASFVGQQALGYGLSMGFDALMEEIGLLSEGPDLSAALGDINQSLVGIQQQLDAISEKIDVGKADTDFKNSHRLAAVAMGNIKTVAASIASAEAGVAEPTQGQLESWASDNRNNIKALKSLLVDPLTGAVPLMLDYYQLKYPISSGIEVRTEVDGYLDGFRAGLGVALLNQVWLSDAFAPNRLYDEGAEQDARDAVEAAYDMAGAPYPQPPGEAIGFIHRLGEDWALIDASRPVFGGESEREATQDFVDAWSLYKAIGAGVDAPGDLSIGSYMDGLGVDRRFRAPSAVHVYSEGDGVFNCRDWVGVTELSISGNRAGSNVVRTYTGPNYWCLTNNNKAKNEADKLKQQLRETEWVYSVDVSTNSWGMPALMDETFIQGHRDGIDVEALVRGEGDAVTLSYGKNGYGRLQVLDPESGEVYFTGANKARTLSLGSASGAVEVVQGYRVQGRSGEDSIVPMERTIVTANLGSMDIKLILDPS